MKVLQYVGHVGGTFMQVVLNWPGAVRQPALLSESLLWTDALLSKSLRYTEAEKFALMSLNIDR